MQVRARPQDLARFPDQLVDHARGQLLQQLLLGPEAVGNALSGALACAVIALVDAAATPSLAMTVNAASISSWRRCCAGTRAIVPLIGCRYPLHHTRQVSQTIDLDT